MTMKQLIWLIAIVSTTVGLAFWQAASLRRVQQEITQTSGRIRAAQQGIESERAILSSARGRLGRSRDERSRIRREAAEEAGMLSELTPEQEGWWPKDKSYFYLAKSRLSHVQFRKARLPIAEVNARLTQRAAARNPSIISVAVSADRDGMGTVEYRLFESNELNPDMAMLLGMDETEVQSAKAIYAKLRNEVKQIEAARIQRIDPPRPADTTVAGQVVIAQMPDLSEDVDPLVAAWTDELRQLLGDTRARILGTKADKYFSQFEDKLGRVPREFIRDGDMLIIQYRERWGKSQSPYTIGLPVLPGSDYSHLFGPGAPCELK